VRLVIFQQYEGQCREEDVNVGATGLGPGPEGWGPTACTGGLCGLMKTRGLVWRKTATSLGKEGGGKGEETRGRL
jgi:hypothetical protein